MENLQSDHLDTQNLYRDMQKRTGGEIYIGVVGPVRTGKSTFIKRFMDVAVLPYMEDAAQKVWADDDATGNFDQDAMKRIRENGGAE